MLNGVELIGGRLAVNVLAAGPENAAAVVRQAGQSVLVGMITKGLTYDQAVARVDACQALGVPVSVGLGAGDPSVWRLAANVARATKAAHVNQVFPTAAVTAGLLEGSGTVVNALISPSGTPGRVIISAGPLSHKAAEPAIVSVDTAAAMLAEAGIPSVKFFPLNGAWGELKSMATAAARAGIPIFEPTGGIDASNLAEAAAICLEAGCPVVIPHVYSAVVDKATGETIPSKVVELVEMLTGLISA
jgi:2-dehydro-3-deoxy-phosphogluconate aldolase